MSSLTMPRGLGLFAALAVSGTALYLVYGYKKKPFVNVLKGKGSLRVEYRAVQPLKKESGASLELPGGQEINIVEIHHLSGQRKPRWQQPLLLLSAPGREEEELREKLAKCTADAALVKSLHTTLTTYKITDQLPKQFENPSDVLLAMSSGSCEEKSEAEDGSARDSLLSSPSPRSVGDECSPGALSSAASSSRYALVGCFVSSGGGTDGKVPEKPKKVVRFCPTVVEPSSNNQDYRRRFKSEIAQRAAANAHQRTQAVQSSEAVRSIAYDRPRLYSQAAKHTITSRVLKITYNVHRGSRSYYGN